jgi:hypothetical protein
MFLVTKKKYKALLMHCAELQLKYDELVTDHRELVDQNNGIKLRVYRLTNQLEQANQMLLNKKSMEGKRHE